MSEERLREEEHALSDLALFAVLSDKQVAEMTLESMVNTLELFRDGPLPDMQKAAMPGSVVSSRPMVDVVGRLLTEDLLGHCRWTDPQPFRASVFNEPSLRLLFWHNRRKLLRVFRCIAWRDAAPPQRSARVWV